MFISTRVRNLRIHPKHRINARTLLFSILACSMLIASLALVAAPVTQTARSDSGKLALAFVPNKGQTDAEVMYQAYDFNKTIFLTATDMVFSLAEKGQQAPVSVRISHENAQSHAAISAHDQLPGQVNFLLGNDSSKWLTHIPTFGSILYRNLYQGIDLVYEGSQGAFESVYYVTPGADPAQIALRTDGSAAARINPDSGAIEVYGQVETAGKPVLTMQAPMAYQEIHGQQVIVPSRYTQKANGAFAFALGSYDPTHTLVIDPVVTYSTYFGGSSLDTASGVAVDSSGIYITGSTNSTGMSKAGEDAFVVKLDLSGTKMLYSTYLGGGDDDAGNAIAVDSSGSAYIAGDTSSPDYPRPNGYSQSCISAPFPGFNMPDAMLTRLSPDGTKLLYSTCLGGMNMDSAEGIAVGGNGIAYLVGMTTSGNFPGASASLIGQAAFVTKIDTNAVGAPSLQWSKVLGGGASDIAMAVTHHGTQVTLTGTATSSNFPVKNALQSSYGGNGDIFITALTENGDIVYSTFLGGSGQDSAYGIASDAQGNAYITGSSQSTNMPTKNAVQTANKGGSDAILTGIKSDGSAWLFNTYLGGSGNDYGYGIAVDSAGAIRVAGGTQSGDFPQPKTMQAYKGNGDGFVAKFAADGSGPVYSTLLGGGDSDTCTGVAVDTNGKVYVVGNTFSADFPTQPKKDYAGNGDAFVTILNESQDTPPVVDTPVPDPTIVIPNLQAVNPLFGSFKIASNVFVKPGENITYSIMLHNSRMAPINTTVVDTLPTGIGYVDGSANFQGGYDKTTNAITWTVPVPANDEIELKFTATTSTSTPKVVVNTAKITANGSTLQRSFIVTVNAQPAPINLGRPKVESFTIGDTDILTSRNVTLHIQASESSDSKSPLKSMYLREWQISTSPVPHWELVKSSGWINYATSLNWTLGERAGVHYIAIQVADENKMVSIFNHSGLDFANLLIPDTTLKAGSLIPYLVSYPKGTLVKAQMAPTSGNPDLYVWGPENILVPDWFSANPGTATEKVEFTTAKEGTYLFLVHAVTDTTYTLQITPAGGSASAAAAGTAAEPAGLAPAAQGTLLTKEPLLSVIGFDPLASGGSMPDNTASTFFLPLIRN